MLELIQAWAYAFRTSDKYQAVKVSYQFEDDCFSSSFSFCLFTWCLHFNAQILHMMIIENNNYFAHFKQDTMTILKTKGHKFPELKEADAMFTSDTAPTWHDGKVCHRCRVEFSFTQRKHHCRNCGQVFCSQCSAKSCTLPKFGIEKEVCLYSLEIRFLFAFKLCRFI